MNQSPQPTGLPPSPGSPILRLAGVSKRFGSHQALQSIDLSVDRGEILGVIGRSGAGKSTLIRCINGLEQPDEGRVEVEGRSIERLGERELQPLRRRVGMVFQHFNLLANRTAAENIALPLKIAGMARADRARRVAELLDLVGLGGRGDRFPAQMSGGQKQRVGIARALAADPALLLSDEATSALDPETTEQILALLADINRRLGLTIVLITHEMEVVRRIAGRVVVLEGGVVAEEGPTWRVFAEPASPVTRTLLQTITAELPQRFLDVLSPEPVGEAVLRLDFGGERADDPVISDFTRAFGRPARIVGGHVDEIQGRPVGRLFIGVAQSGPDDLKAVMDFLAARTLKTECLGYVRRAD
jgi:D-methionine transport system ATP-binding protein